MQRAWLFFFVVTLVAVALGMGMPSRATAVDSPSIAKGANSAGIQVTATATLPSAIATAIPTTMPAAGTVGEGPNIMFVIALLLIVGGAVLLWRRQWSGRNQNM